MRRMMATWVLGLVCVSTAQTACSSSKDGGASTASSATLAAKTASAVQSSAPAATPSAPPPPPVQKGVKVSFDGQELSFEHAWVEEANGPTITLSNKPWNCSGELDKDAYTMFFSLRPGPGGNHFASGKPVAISPTFYKQKTAVTVPVESWENGAQASIEPFEYKDGAVVKGEVHIAYEDEVNGKKFSYKGGGSFEAKVCSSGDHGRFPAPASAPDGAVSGSLEGKDFNAQTVLAYTTTMDTYSWVANIYLVDGPATCADMGDLDRGKKRSVMFRPRGANSREKLAGSPQPADVTVGFGNGKTESLSWDGEAWINLDAVDFTAEVIKGKLALGTQKVAQGGDHYVDAKLAGSFEAKVCR